VERPADKIPLSQDPLARLRGACLSCASVLCVTFSAGASAAPITYYLSSTIGSGSLGTITLFNTPVEFTVVSDTNGVQEVPGGPTDPPGSFYQNTATTSATMTVHLPDGTTQTATFEPASQILVAEDRRNYGVAIGSTAGGHIYPFGLVNISSLPSAAMDATPVPITGLPYACANFDPALGFSNTCTPVSLTVRIANSPNVETVLINKQLDSGCGFSTTCPARGVYAAVTSPTLFVLPATPAGGTISATGATLSCPGTCSAAVTPGQDLLLTATPAPGYAFAAWSGACQGNAPTCAVNVSGVVTSVQAQFVPLPQAPAIATSISDSGTYSTGPLCTLTSAGSVQCWGTFWGGQSGTPVGLPGFTGTAVSVAGGTSFACLVTQSGATQCEGDNNYGVLGNGSFAYTVTTAPATVSGLGSGGVAVAANYFSACALNTSGGLQCWGYNNLGQLGNGTMTDSAVPVRVSGLGTGVVAMAMGQWHACAVVNTGGVECWGNNSVGQLGNGTLTNSSIPVAVVGLTAPAVAIATGQIHTCALTSAGGVLCWGDNFYGQLGNPPVSPYSSAVPVAVSGLSTGVVAIAAGDNHTCALTTAGAIKCWGLNSSGQLGNATISSVSGGSALPVDVVGIPGGVMALTAGGNQTCAVTSAGAARCWGDNTFLQLGSWSAPLSVDTPVPVVGLGRDFVSLSAGLLHTCAVDNSGAAQCWGDNTNGGLGNGATTDSSTAVGVTGLATGVLATTSGDEHSCALTAGGVVQCWGFNGHGQLGNGTQADSPLPLAVTGLAGAAIYVSAGANHTCAVTAAGAVQCWGYNQYGQLGNLTTTDSPSPVNVGLASQAVSVAGADWHTCALTAGGAVQCWGYNNFGQVGNGSVSTAPVLAPATVVGLSSGISAIATGSTHTCALTNGGGVQCWGANNYGQLGNGTNTLSPVPVPVSGLGSGVIAISSTAYHSCALTYGGAVLCWGYNGDGELGNGSLTNSSMPVPVSGLSTAVVALAAGGGHTCALMSAGTTLCWGGNANGQLGNGNTTSASTPVPIKGLVRDNSLVMTNPAGLPAVNASLIAGGGTLSLAATASSGLAPVFSTFTRDRCAVSGSTVIPMAPGLCAVQANQAGNGNVNPAPTQTRIIVIPPSAAPGQTITFGPAPSVTVGTTGTLLAGASSGLPVTFSSLTPAVCTVSGSTVTGIAAGSCVVAADQAGNTIYSAAPQVTQTFTTSLNSQTISVGAAPVVRVGVTGTLSATASSGLPVTFSSITPATCTVSGSTVTGVVTGTCTVQATQAGDSSFSAAPIQTIQIVVLPALPNDFNGDGKSDLLWQNTNGAASMWLMNGATPQSFISFGPYAGWTVLSGEADFNGDGKSDLVWTNTNGAASIWLMNGTTVLSTANFGPYSGWTLMSGNADFNGDGNTDLVWTNTNGAVSIWLMSGTMVLSTAIFGPYAGWTLVSANNDFNGDGKSDLLWTNSNGAASIWLMNGTTPLSYGSYGPFPGWTVLSGDADYNGDGKTDLLWTNTNGAASIWLMNGTTPLSEAAFGPYPGWTVASGRRDFNGDGNSDLLWTNTSGAASVWLMNGTTVTTTGAYGPYAGWSVVRSVGDYNGDGKTDLLWTNTNGEASIWLMNGTTVLGTATFGPFPGWTVVSDRVGP
jgi:alpha-tubulin suppressor-like RCC1 family protein